eukprot:scaffold137622_cov51-Phaeocystis_antarctica.AAC.2
MVIGNVTDPADADQVTGTTGVEIDLHIETTTSYQAAHDHSNHMRQAGGVNTFGEINLKGPGEVGAISSVGLTFTFKRRDTNAEVTIPWMQFSLLDFDQSSDSGDVGQECAVATGFEDYAVSSGPGVVNPTTGTSVTTVNINNGDGSVNSINSGKFCSAVKGYGSDNPSNPGNLTDLERSKAVSFFFRNFSKFDVTLSVKSAGSGRNFEFVGVANNIEKCPTPPNAPPPPSPPPSPWPPQTVWSSGPYSAPNGDAGSVTLPAAFCVTISDLVLQSRSSCGTWSPQDGRSGRTIAVLGTEANDCDAGFKIYYSRNCKGINMGVSSQGHWWKTASTLDLPAGVSYNVSACYSSASTELVVTGPSGIVATEQSSCYPCMSASSVLGTTGIWRVQAWALSA